MYPVRTHWIVEIDVPSSCPSVGIATFTIVRSRTVMIVPRTTTPASTMSSGSRPTPRAVGVGSGVCVIGAAGGAPPAVLDVTVVRDLVVPPSLRGCLGDGWS